MWYHMTLTVHLPSAFCFEAATVSCDIAWEKYKHVLNILISWHFKQISNDIKHSWKTEFFFYCQHNLTYLHRTIPQWDLFLGRQWCLSIFKIRLMAISTEIILGNCEKKIWCKVKLFSSYLYCLYVAIISVLEFTFKVPQEEAFVSTLSVATCKCCQVTEWMLRTDGRTDRWSVRQTNSKTEDR